MTVYPAQDQNPDFPNIACEWPIAWASIWSRIDFVSTVATFKVLARNKFQKKQELRKLEFQKKQELKKLEELVDF